jgi:hypothetical protein
MNNMSDHKTIEKAVEEILSEIGHPVTSLELLSVYKQQKLPIADMHAAVWSLVDAGIARFTHDWYVELTPDRE